MSGGKCRQSSEGGTWFQPAFTRDGSEVAYVYWASNFSDIFVMSADGSSSRRLTRGQSASLPEDVRERLIRLAGSRATQEGVIVLFSQGSRSQELNRQEAIERLVDLVRRATERPKPRKKTRPTYASKLKRLEGKAKRSGVKAMRGRVRGDD